MKKLDKKFRWKFFFVSVSSLLTISMILIASCYLDSSTKDCFFWSVLLIILNIVCLPLFWIWAKWTHHFYSYELKEEGFYKEMGVIWKAYTTIPYDRIQNIDIRRGLWDRLLGLSCLHIQTAGNSSKDSNAEGKLPGLSIEIAEKLQAQLIEYTKKSKSSGGL